MSDSIKGIRYRTNYLLMKLGLLADAGWSSKKMVFIVSTGRTGTKFLARFFNKYDGIYALHEPRPDFLAEGIKYAAGKLSDNKAVDILKSNRSAIYREVVRRGDGIYVESNNRLFALLKPLKKTFKDAKIIHIVRDGRDYVRSGMSRNWYKKSDSTLRLEATLFPDDPYFEKWKEMSRFEKIAWRWQKKDGFIYDTIKDITDTLTVKFEDIFYSDNYKGLRKIAEYVGADNAYTETLIKDLVHKKVNFTSNYSIKEWHKWNADKKDRFYAVAGRHLEKYGYR
ncbi:MAG: sulfotransferase [Elusimicrobia bacterium]|jgi:hypothetical protein|nr:sulfotransferase [Elusimicrobiota bacterium]